ncbi:hypothetical protein [Defluviimonas sp. WL0075]|uniref:Uncharacterized protein n=1 Tax=Albidovulum sediminicola TaxID=2984331 RepID=A0ABT2Z4Q1_9RHOB|nr:hypothetical protein [Defluviimonas sp. WL0075]MCV2866119.1 hypothetical protein [Defluviimonas sp. WL0075]
MKTALLVAAATFLLPVGSALAHEEGALQMSPPGAPYIQVSDALPLPEFIPGLGTLFVDPATLPAGPFLAYDHDGRLSATIYMTPLDDLRNGTSYDGLGVGSHTVSSVDIYYNAGHPGVEAPHAHVVLFHDEDAKSRLAE